MKYSQNKTYVVKMSSVKLLMEKIESVSFVLWLNGKTPKEFCVKPESCEYLYPKNGDYCIYNGRHGFVLTWNTENKYEFSTELTEDEFVEMLSMLAPKR
jgi:hypothetical protein